MRENFMRERASLVAAIVVAIALVLSGCDSMTSDPEPMTPSLDGTWVFTGFEATIAGESVTVTVGDGMNALSPDPTSTYAAVARIVVKGVLAVDGMGYKLTLSEEADAITVTAVPGAPPGTEAQVAIGVRELITAVQMAQAGAVTITVDADADPNTMTVEGSFIVTLASALGQPVTQVVGCKGAPCTTP